MKEFNTAVKEASEDDDQGTPFMIDDKNLLAYKPVDGQLIMLMASTGRSTSDSDRIAGVINFFVKVLDEKGAMYIENRLLDRNDPFGIEDIEEIMEWMIEEWSGHPTQGPSGSSTSPPNDGQKSTLLTPQ